MGTQRLLRRATAVLAMNLGALALSAPAGAHHQVQLLPNESAWQYLGQTRPFNDQTAWPRRGAIRGMTIGPIESSLHPGLGYGSEAYQRTLRETRRLGGNWVSLTPFGRVWDLKSTGVDPTFEAPFAENYVAIQHAVEQAHAQGLRVMLVPHLWVESGEWRAEIDPGDDAGWERWAKSYEAYLLGWAKLAEATHVDLMSLGVELRSWVTTTRAPSFSALIAKVRKVYSGPITYAANWDDVDQTVILGELDVIGINAFFPLADKEGSDVTRLLKGARDVSQKIGDLAKAWSKPVVFTEIGYTTRTDPAIKPWEWPDKMKDVQINQEAQADAYAALIAPLLDEPWFVGYFVWRMYADPDDLSQEAEWGFNPRGKQSELIVRDAFAASWASDGSFEIGSALATPASEAVGKY